MPWFKNKYKAERLFWGGFRVLGLAFFAILVGFPFYWMLASSLKPLQEILMNPANLFIDLGRITLTAYTQVLFEHGFLRYLLNSALVSLATVFLTLVLATLGGYAATRLGFRGKKALSGGILAIYMLPAIVLVIPLYVLLTKLGLHDSLPALVVVYLAQTLPVALYMLRSYFLTLPVELEYAGMIDGCTRLQVIRRIILPLAAPALASVALYTFMIAWNGATGRERASLQTVGHGSLCNDHCSDNGFILVVRTFSYPGTHQGSGKGLKHAQAGTD
jgi:multiple sugar transport system permease protein